MTENKQEQKISRDDALMLQIKKTATANLIPLAQKLMEAGYIRQLPNSTKLLFSAITKVDAALGVGNFTWKDVSQTKLVSALINVVLLDLDLENNEAWAIPYKNKSGQVEVQFPRSGPGEYKIRSKYGLKKPKIFNVEVIREGDTFIPKYSSARNDYEFNPILFSHKPIIGAFAFVEWEDGTTKLLLWSRDEIDRRKAASAAKMGGKESPAWKTWEEAMVKTKITKAVFKNEPFEIPAPEIQDALNETGVEIEEVETPSNKRIPMKYDATAFDADFEEVTEPAEEEKPAEPEKAETAKEEPKQDKPKQQKMV